MPDSESDFLGKIRCSRLLEVGNGLTFLASVLTSVGDVQQCVCCGPGAWWLEALPFHWSNITDQHQ